MKEKLERQVKAANPTIQERVALMKEEKKLKGILKNSTAAPAQEKPETSKPTTTSIPDDFFDSKTKSPEVTQNGSSAKNAPEEEKPDDAAIPEGFFDDPMKDAKARHIEYKDPVEEEWEKFKKEIKEAETVSMNIITEEQEELTAERQIDEIEAQMRNWKR